MSECAEEAALRLSWKIRESAHTDQIHESYNTVAKQLSPLNADIVLTRVFRRMGMISEGWCVRGITCGVSNGRETGITGWKENETERGLGVAEREEKREGEREKSSVRRLSPRIIMIPFPIYVIARRTRRVRNAVPRRYAFPGRTLRGRDADIYVATRTIDGRIYGK